MAELKFEITKSLGVLSENAKGWTKELNMVSWNEHEPKYDIREWSPDHTRMGKGVTLTEEEINNLRALLNGEELLPESERGFSAFLYSGTLEHGVSYQLSNGIKTISVTAN